MRVGAIVALVILAAGAIGTASALFTVHQTQQALVLQFGEAKRVVTDPGLHVKVPFIQNVIYMERRALPYDATPSNVNLSDDRRLEVDAFLRFQISDPLLFYQAVRTEDVARQRLRAFLDAALRDQFALVTSTEVLSGERQALMGRIRDQVNVNAAALGVSVVDVRVKRTDLPQENYEPAFNRIRAERQQEAVEERSSGQEQKERIMANADREVTVMLAEAERDAQTLRGEGDAQALSIINLALTRNPEFYAFYRSLEAYRSALADGNTSIVLSPDSEFFSYFNGQLGARTQ